jgi:hypothetical protein
METAIIPTAVHKNTSEGIFAVSFSILVASLPFAAAFFN